MAQKDGFTANPGKKSDWKWYHKLALVLGILTLVSLWIHFAQ